jgi:DNA repair exonuclease SbcCD ATPase subunit
VLSHAH